VIDYELVFDVWSLLFCVLRMDEPSLKNIDYTRVLYKDYRTILTQSQQATFLEY